MNESAPETAPAPRRARGRPRAAAAGETSAQILRAAGEEFAAHGYEAASLRAVARRAGVDPALVHHYFADKSDLFAATMQMPFRPDRAVAQVLAGPREQIGAGLARFILQEWSKPGVQSRGTVVLRAAIGNNPASRMIKEFLVREIFHRIAVGIQAPDAELRASLAASQVVGLILTRYVLKLEPLASAPVDDLVRRIGPVLQWHLVDFDADGRLGPNPLDTPGATGE